MTANPGSILHEWQQQVVSKCFERRTGRHEQMPSANAFFGSVRRECLDHFLILQEKQLHRLLKSYVVYYNQARPHQGIRQRLPDLQALSAPPPNQPNQVVSIPVLGGLHHNYQRAA